MTEVKCYSTREVAEALRVREVKVREEIHAGRLRAFGVGRLLLRLQTGDGGGVLNLAPRALLVPAALETLAEQLVSSLVVPNVAANLSADFIKSLSIIACAYLDATSATAFYVLAGPGTPIIEVGFLNGARTPTLIPINVAQSVGLSGILGLEWAVYIDVAVAPLDWRGAVRNAGA